MMQHLSSVHAAVVTGQNAERLMHEKNGCWSTGSLGHPIPAGHIWVMRSDSAA